MSKKTSELRAKTPSELKKDLLELKREHMNLRFQQATMQLENTARIRDLRRQIARIKTLLNQKAAEV
jgi:large subunit ribosomal protein L29